MKEITLTNGMVALVDDEDFVTLSAYTWSAFKSKTHHTWYALRRYRENGHLTGILMHRQILGFVKGDGKLVDHKNYIGLDNQRHNLRQSNKSINNLNSDIPTKALSGFRGVRKDPRRSAGRLWSARIKHMRVCYCIGSFYTAEEAAQAYDAKATELFGENARLNFPVAVAV